MGCIHSSHVNEPSSPPSPARPARPDVDADSAQHDAPATLRLPRRAPSPPPSFADSSRSLTTSVLARERLAFFDTRTSGSAEVWGAIQLASNLLRDEQDSAGAGAVMAAVGARVVDGRIDKGVWDERGALYRVPAWVLVDPRGVVGDHVPAEDEVKTEADDEQDPQKEEALEERTLQSPGAEKIKVRCRLSDRATDVLISVGKDAPVKTLVHMVKSKASISDETEVRLFYLGHVLKPEHSLDHQGWSTGQTVSAFVFVH